MKYFKNRKEAGDTIVEVLVVLTVLGLAITIGYAIASRSLLDTQQAEQASGAEEILQYQAEALDSMSINPPGTANGYLFTPGEQPFCIIQTQAAGANVAYAMQNLPSSSCKDGIYNISINFNFNSITPTSPGSSGYTPGGTFTITATWPDLLGNGQDTATLIYNTYYNETYNGS